MNLAGDVTRMNLAGDETVLNLAEDETRLNLAGVMTKLNLIEVEAVTIGLYLDENLRIQPNHSFHIGHTRGLEVDTHDAIKFGIAIHFSAIYPILRNRKIT